MKRNDLLISYVSLPDTRASRNGRNAIVCEEAGRFAEKP